MPDLLVARVCRPVAAPTDVVASGSELVECATPRRGIKLPGSSRTPAFAVKVLKVRVYLISPARKASCVPVTARRPGLAGMSRDVVKGGLMNQQQQDRRPVGEFLQQRVEEAVKRAMHGVRIPRREHVEQLNARLDAVVKRLEALAK